VDFPEEETRSSDAAPFARALAGMARTLDLHLERAPQARMMREGVATVIYGRPNVGKSSLLNALLRRERAIVTAVPGTTRDTVEEEVQRGGTTFRLIDTAGIVAARDAVEEEALARSRQAVAAADIVLFVLDGAAPLEEADRRLFASLEEKRRLLLVNKSDLPEAWPRTAVHGWTRRPVFEVSARTGAGIPALEGALVESVFDGPPAAEETVWVTDTRHIEALRRGREALGRACASLEEGLPLDVAALDVRACAESIGVVTGAVCTQEILDAIFSKFCIGK
ncbi:MAG: tRNA modification GTPase, partial [Deltaproteobacteria bacterium]